MTPERRAYILNYLSKAGTGNWIRISEHEFDDFGGRWFFEGCRCVYQHDEQWFTTKPGTQGWIKEERVRLPWKIETPTIGWQPPAYTASTNSAITLTNSTITSHSITNEGKPEMQEHHIDRAKLIEVVVENGKTYIEKYKKLKALYADEIEAKTQLHLEGKIPQQHIMVTDKQNSRIELPVDSSSKHDARLRALELDSRDVIVLSNEEYRKYVCDDDTNLALIEELIGKLEELS